MALHTKFPTDPPELKRLVEPATLGDPMRPLIWVSKSMDKLADMLELVKLGFSRQHNRKADEGAKHPDRNAQFEHINTKVVAAQAAGQPVISVDTRRRRWSATIRTAAPTTGPRVIRRANVYRDERQALTQACECARLRQQGAGQGGTYGVYGVRRRGDSQLARTDGAVRRAAHPLPRSRRHPLSTSVWSS
jgi:hypothetical protein